MHFILDSPLKVTALRRKGDRVFRMAFVRDVTREFRVPEGHLVKEYSRLPEEKSQKVKPLKFRRLVSPTLGFAHAVMTLSLMTFHKWAWPAHFKPGYESVGASLHDIRMSEHHASESADCCMDLAMVSPSMRVSESNS